LAILGRFTFFFAKTLPSALSLSLLLDFPSLFLLLLCSFICEISLAISCIAWLLIGGVPGEAVFLLGEDGGAPFRLAGGSLGLGLGFGFGKTGGGLRFSSSRS
jgi:hypothetical protein